MYSYKKSRFLVEFHIKKVGIHIKKVGIRSLNLQIRRQKNFCKNRKKQIRCANALK